MRCEQIEAVTPFWLSDPIVKRLAEEDEHYHKLLKILFDKCEVNEPTTTEGGGG